MTNKIAELLFHPKTLSKYRYTRTYKVFLYLLVLTIFFILVPILDFVISPELDITDKRRFSQMLNIDFDVAKDLPNCALDDYIYTCIDEESKQQEILTILDIFKVVSDEDNKYTKNGLYLIKLTKERVYVVNQLGFTISVEYDDLPKSWQSFDFTEIKNSTYPSDSLYYLVVGGINEIIKQYLPLIIISNILMNYVIHILELLFLTAFLYLVYSRFQYKYFELFKIAVFGRTLPITISVILNLLHIYTINSLIITFLTFLYVHLAVMKNIPLDREF